MESKLDYLTAKIDLDNETIVDNTERLNKLDRLQAHGVKSNRD